MGGWADLFARFGMAAQAGLSDLLSILQKALKGLEFAVAGGRSTPETEKPEQSSTPARANRAESLPNR